ncbi:MAG TPA: RNA 2',3'-cyclic phosphodiesterase [Elusimicrobia bacterium]|nr:MAG: 2'-5' RNA ligase [Elusimicrobia bacterium RIFOXYA12_FULL_49_49]OGS08895.1 MAG: 2'-5' RNA ligase [Elusimicrobia bacterium RIFOXYA1_FULL_47_7]OGS10479.1 MAG: 2'-5' RNA ligase [Elusimicrobia bacterium RIFOXYB1_FULL_48_9]OGS14702.1 MAG: 2'-5' RNA ligase [Elusimicrobia bacterium RIFOXYA2_FULL_47_53]OGS25646.1 MAG: 2'-5' RNA ligase [Elusimicrobia bacterium RIFOXYB12_FULL_50_12]OGS31793.1 MAG: 2'-5' RNA ligase [Elusimicrobia bacterium RIFOXYB2_FULL_46_23]HBU69675.1 RNA 2',3'-cyclic phosphodi
MRCFIAVNIPLGIKEKAALARKKLSDGGTAVKWVEKENLHITLKFLGEIKENTAGDIGGKLKAAARGFGSFKVSLGGLGAYPATDCPQIVWAGIGSGRENLELLAFLCEDAAAECGVKREARPFSAHLTLGRVKNRKHSSLIAEKLKSAPAEDLGSFEVNSIDLMESVLKDSGPEYKCLESISIL